MRKLPQRERGCTGGVEQHRTSSVTRPCSLNLFLCARVSHTTRRAQAADYAAETLHKNLIVELQLLQVRLT
jgi:hypothetical protein